MAALRTRTPISCRSFARIFAVCVIVCGIAKSSAHAGEAALAKRALIISTGSRLSPGFTAIDRAILEALGNNPSERIDIDAENLDILRFPADRFQKIFSEYLTVKYAEQPPDLIILVFVGSLGIAGNLLNQVFPGTPVIVAGATEEEVRADQFRGPVSGLAFRVNPRETLELIFRLQPETRRVVVIGGAAEVDRQVLDRVKEAAKSCAGRAEFEFWNNRSMAELRQAVSALSPQTAILFSRMFRDGAGQAVISTQAGQSIAQWANAPVYVMTDTALGTGAVGGSVASVEVVGKRVGELARLVLSGTALASLPLESDTGSVPMFDWRALKRWGIPENRLPPGSVVLNKPTSIWMQYGWYIVGALILLGVQSAVIIDLLLERRRRRRIQAELRESQQLMELATTAGEIGLWARDLESGTVWANASLRSMFGLDKEGTIQLSDMLARIHPDDSARVTTEAQRAQEDDVQFEGEFRVPLANGTVRWMLSKGRNVQLSQNPGLRRMGVVLDITERKRGEERFRLVVEAMPIAIVMVNLHGKIQLINALAEKLFGYSREELIGQPIEMFVPERLRAESTPHRAMFLAMPQAWTMAASRHLTAKRKDGSELLVETGLNPINTPEGEMLLVSIVDVTERRQMELELQRDREELEHLTRVSTVAELTTSVAHELNQPLGAILSNAEAAEMFLAADPPVLDEVRNILADIRHDDQRAGEVIRRMRSLLRKQELAPKSIEINEAMDEVLKLLSIDASARKVKLNFERTAALPRVWCDPVHLQQVVMNLVLNGMDATAPLPEEKRQVVIRTGSGDNGTVKIAVTDSGLGIPADKLPKVFDPFFTTKKEGMGMGLSIARTIVEAHHGRIWVENNGGGGATFCFTVPVEKRSGEGRGSSDNKGSVEGRVSSGK